MTVAELKALLEDYNDDMEVVMKPSNSMYVDGLSGAKVRELCSFYGKDRKVLVITSGGQEGSV